MAISNVDPLGLGKILGSVLSALLDAEKQSSQSSVDFVGAVGLVKDEATQADRLRTLRFHYRKKDENDQPADFEAEIPMLTLVSVPNLTVKDATIDFSYDLTTAKEVTGGGASSDGGLSGSPAPAVLEGYVRRSSRGESRADTSIDVSVVVERGDLPIGIERTLDLAELSIGSAPRPVTRPTNLVPPSISGEASIGQTLSADPGRWKGTAPVALTFQWMLVGEDGTASEITGATGRTHVVTEANGGSALAVTVTATNRRGAATVASAPTATVHIPPTNQTPPSILGTPQVGSELVADAGNWEGSPAPRITLQWQRRATGGATSVIPGATAARYIVAPADVGSRILVVATAANVAGTAAASSAPTAVVTSAPSPPSNTRPPAISGLARVGSELLASPGEWSGAPVPALSFQWRRLPSSGAATDIPGATAARYVAAPADAGSALVVAVTATSSAGTATSASTPTAVVQDVVRAPTNTKQPAIVGEPYLGELLTAEPGEWTGAPTFDYQWLRCDPMDRWSVDIVGAKDRTYIPSNVEDDRPPDGDVIDTGGGDEGARLRVRITASNSAGMTSATSDATDVVRVRERPPLEDRSLKPESRRTRKRPS